MLAYPMILFLHTVRLAFPGRPQRGSGRQDSRPGTELASGADGEVLSSDVDRILDQRGLGHRFIDRGCSDQAG